MAAFLRRGLNRMHSHVKEKALPIPDSAVRASPSRPQETESEKSAAAFFGRATVLPDIRANALHFQMRRPLSWAPCRRVLR